MSILEEMFGDAALMELFGEWLGILAQSQTRLLLYPWLWIGCSPHPAHPNLPSCTVALH